MLDRIKMLFYYIISKSFNDLNEINGIIDTDSKDSAIKIIISSGFVIREIRPANIYDYRILKLKQFKDKLNDNIKPEQANKTNKFSKKYYLIPLIIVLVILIWEYFK